MNRAAPGALIKLEEMSELWSIFGGLDQTAVRERICNTALFEVKFICVWLFISLAWSKGEGTDSDAIYGMNKGFSVEAIYGAPGAPAVDSFDHI